MPENPSAATVVARHIPTRAIAWAAIALVAAFVALVGLVLAAVVFRFDFNIAGMNFGRSESQPQASTSLPDGAVVAFDRDSGCPRDWSLFEPAISRTIVGAVAGRSASAPTQDENGELLSARQYRADGGAEMHTLTVEEMPGHTHAFPADTEVVFLDRSADRETDYIPEGQQKWENFITKGPKLDTVGKGNSHNNMPPYIALYFCKKEG